MSTIIQRNFSGGELAPSLYSRCDTVKYATGLRTMRNFFTQRQGGAASRPGSSFVRKSAIQGHPIRLIPFIFSNDQATIIEIGHNYINPLFNYVAGTGTSITSITKASVAVVTMAAGSVPSNGTKIFIDNVVGMRQINHQYYIVANRNNVAGTFELQDLNSSNINSTSFDVFTSGEFFPTQFITTTYSYSEIFDIRYVQSGDVITFTHPSHAPAQLTRASGGTYGTWTLANINFNPAQVAPTGTSHDGAMSALQVYYAVTAINATTNEESLAYTAFVSTNGMGQICTTSGTATIVNAGATRATPGNLTLNGPNVSGGHWYALADFDGTTHSTHGCPITITSSGATSHSGLTFTIYGLDRNGDALSESIIGPVDNATVQTQNYFRQVDRVSASAAVGGAGLSVGNSANMNLYPSTIKWSAASGAGSYNVYRGPSQDGPFGFVGNTVDPLFIDTGATPDFTKSPAASTTDFQSTDNYPTCCTYYQQKLCLANTNTNPEGVWTSRTGNFHNFTRSSPIQDDDSIKFTLAGRQINAVRHMADLGRLILFTQSGEWGINGDSSGSLTPTAINAKQQSYNGCNNLAPIVIDTSALYTQAKGSVVRDINFSFQVDKYTGEDLTVFSAHLFDGFTLVDWAYQKTPHSLVWAARNDGALIGLTYIRDQQILGWHRHDFEGGLVESVASVPGTSEDLLYLSINRSGSRYIEVLNTRFVDPNAIEDSIFMDSAVTYDDSNQTTNTIFLNNGTTWAYQESMNLISNAAIFLASDVGKQFWLTGSDGTQIRFTITAYSGTTVLVGYPNRDVPVSMQGVATADYGRTIQTLTGLDHLEGKNVSVFADGFVVASPHNSAYDVLTVTNGSITLPSPHVTVHVGLPITADIETLDVDSPNQETLISKAKLITKVNVRVENSRGMFVGGQAPTGTDYLENLMELKTRSTEFYDDPVALVTDVVSVNIPPDWNSNGRVFIRQVDPLPLTINAIAPAVVLLNGGD